MKTLKRKILATQNKYAVIWERSGQPDKVMSVSTLQRTALYEKKYCPQPQSELKIRRVLVTCELNE